MTYFVGNKGNIKIKRAGSGVLNATASPDDINTALNRVSVPGIGDGFLTGDYVTLRAAVGSRLDFIDPSAWEGDQAEKELSVFINVNTLDGVRLYRSFSSAINNDRENEIGLVHLATPVSFSIVSDGSAFTVLGDISSYELNTDRGAIEVSSLSDKFRIQYDAGLISGSGKLNALFNYRSNGLTEPSLLLLQVIQRAEIGSSLECAFYLVDKDRNPNAESVFYSLTAVITASGIEVAADDIVRFSADFVTTGNIQLRVGTPTGFVLTESFDTVKLEQSLGSLLLEPDD